jgi:hypothetical protein
VTLKPLLPYPDCHKHPGASPKEAEVNYV